MAATRGDDSPEDCWREFWQDIVLDAQGNLNLDQVKKELYDYRQLMNAASIVYDAVTWGHVSKPNTSPRVVIQLYEEFLQKTAEDAVSEYREQAETGTQEDRVIPEDEWERSGLYS